MPFNIRLQETRAPTGSISLLLYNLLIVSVTRTYLVSFGKRQAYFFKTKLELDLSFFRKATGIFDVRDQIVKKVLIWSNNLKTRTYSRKKFQVRSLFWIFGRKKSTPVSGTYHIPNIRNSPLRRFINQWPVVKLWNNLESIYSTLSTLSLLNCPVQE